MFAALGLLLIFTSLACGQPAQFSFDGNGNLVVQAAENIAPPQILSQPQPQVVGPGALGSFFVVAANTRGLSYQWRFNGANIGSATNDTLLLNNVGAINEGQYAVVLINSSGSVTSAPAALLLDGDRDGLPDSWELANFGNLNQNPTGDLDGDGVSNLDEFLDVTSPTNSASVLFRLTVLSDGGQVAVNPSRFSFTNGEIVTLTATAIAPSTFRGWTGDTNTTSNPLTLIMTTNKTVFAHLGTYDMTWASTASGNWNVASNWSPNIVPGTNDNVTIARSVTVTLNSDAAIGSLTFGAGSTPTLSGTGALTVQRDSSWFGGTMSGSGRTIIPAGVALNLANASAVALTTRTLENGGTVLWTGANINLSGAVITNRAGAVVENRGVGGLAFNGGSSRFDNAGTFRKTINTGTTTIAGSIAFNNYNTVEIQTGTLDLFGGGLNNGTMDVPAGTTLDLSGGTFTGSAGSSITGAGQFIVSGGTANLAGLNNLSGNHTFSSGTANLSGNYICTNNTVSISGGTANFSGTGTVTPATLNLSGGTLGGSLVVTVLGVMNWTGGEMSGSGRTIIPAGVALNLANASAVALTSRTLENGGTVLWTGGNINLSGAVITNRAGALIENRGAGGLAFNGGTSRFDNAGTFRKAVNTGTTTVAGSIAFNNYNTVEIQTGTLDLFGGGLNNDTMDFPAGTTLDLSGGTFTGSAGSSLTGAGQLIVSGGTANLAGLVNLSGNHTFSSGTANLTGEYYCTNNTVNLSSGTANFSGTGTVTPATLNLSGGTLSGNQGVTVLGGMNWTGGTMSGSGRTIIPAGVALNLANASAVALTTRTLENGGTLLWTGENINLSGAVLTNRAGALVENRGVGGLAFNGGTSRFDNAGTFRKTINTGTTTIAGSIAFNNYNTVEIQTGTLDLFGGGLNNGTMDVPAGTTLDLSGGTFTGSAGSSITGAGQFRWSGGTANLAGLVNVSGTHTINGGTANLTGHYLCTNNTVNLSSGTANFSGTGTVTPATLNLSGGTLGGNQIVTVLGAMNWTGGTMSGSGRTIIPAGVTLNLANASAVALTSRTLENGGTLLWPGGNINLSGAVITNRAGALVENRGVGGLAFNGGTSRFDNAGTFRKTINTGTTTIAGSIAFNNYNTVEIQTGILAANGGYASTTSALLTCAIGGTTVGTGYGRLQVAGTVALNGALGVTLTNGFVPAVNDSFTFLTAGTRNGTFANFYYPSNEVTMLVSNTANSVIVRVSKVLVVPPPILHIEKITSIAARLYWSTNHPDFHLEYNPSLSTSNWAASALTPGVTGTNFVVTNSLFGAQKYYRLASP